MSHHSENGYILNTVLGNFTLGSTIGKNNACVRAFNNVLDIYIVEYDDLSDCSIWEYYSESRIMSDFGISKEHLSNVLMLKNIKLQKDILVFNDEDFNLCENKWIFQNPDFYLRILGADVYRSKFLIEISIKNIFAYPSRVILEIVDCDTLISEYKELWNLINN